MTCDKIKPANNTMIVNTNTMLTKLSLGIFPIMKNYFNNSINKYFYKIICPLLFISSIGSGIYIYYHPLSLTNKFKILKCNFNKQETNEEEKKENLVEVSEEDITEKDITDTNLNK